MPAGFEAYTPSGTVQVLAGFRNFHLRHKFDINEAGTPAHTVSGIVVTRVVIRDFHAINPVMAVTGPLNNFALSCVLQDMGGGVWRVSAYTGGPSVSGTVWIYDSVVTGTPGKAGLEVYLPNGELSFASWAKPMRVVGTATAPFSEAAGSYVQIPAGRRWAVVASRSCQRIERGVGFRLTGPQGDGRGSAGTGRFYYAGENTLIPWADNQTQFSAAGRFFFLDVTGH